MARRESIKGQKGNPPALRRSQMGVRAPVTLQEQKISCSIWGKRGEGNHITGDSGDLAEEIQRSGSERGIIS